MKSLVKFLNYINHGDKCIVSIDCLVEFSGKIKTSTIQHSINKIKKFGICNDILVYRGLNEMSSSNIEKISYNCGIPKNSIFWSKTCNNLYEIPCLYFKIGIYKKIKEILQLKNKKTIFSIEKKNLRQIKIYIKSRTIGIISRYCKHDEPYVSVLDALFNAGKNIGCEISLIFIDYQKIGGNDAETVLLLDSVDGLLLPGGFGDSHIDVKVYLTYYARTKNIPFLGICLWFQIRMIEYARTF